MSESSIYHHVMIFMLALFMLMLKDDLFCLLKSWFLFLRCSQVKIPKLTFLGVGVIGGGCSIYLTS